MRLRSEKLVQKDNSKWVWQFKVRERERERERGKMINIFYVL